MSNSLTDILKQITMLQDELEAAVNTAGEGELLSTGNKKLARLLEAFGVEVAKVEFLAARAGDYYDHLRHKTALAYMEQRLSIDKSKSLARTDRDVDRALTNLRQLEHQANTLHRRSKSYWEYLGQSRSRLSWLSNDRKNA